ncbi:MAG: AAA family ATPase [Clostridia bacterium]|nr:AAA family ATPase [Clostridia bacterium]
MTFESLYIKSFGKLKGKKIVFADGVNIIEGTNESGKSTLCEFIQFIFYGLPSEEKLRYISWDTSLASGSMIVRVKGNRYRIEREVVRTVNEDGKPVFQEKCGIYDAETNMIRFKSRSPGEVFFGVSHSVFESTAYIRQTATAGLKRTELGNEAENILFSGNERLNTEQALVKLNSARAELLNEGAESGKIYKLTEKKKLIDGRLQDAQHQGTDIISLEGSHRVLTEKASRLQKRAKELDDELTEYTCYRIKQTHLDRQREWEKMKQAEAELLKKKNPIDHENIDVSDPAYIGMLEQKQRDLNGIVARHADAKKDLQETVDKITRLNEKISVFVGPNAQDAEQRDLMIQKMESNKKKLDRCNLISIIFAICAVISIVLTLVFRNYDNLPDLMKYLSVTLCLLFGTAAAYVYFMKKHDYDIEIETICQQVHCNSYEEFKELINASSEDASYMSALYASRDQKNQRLNELSNEWDSLCSEIIAVLQDANFRILENAPASLSNALEECRKLQAEVQAIERRAIEHRNKAEEADNRLSEYDEKTQKEAIAMSFDDRAMEAFDLPAKKQERDVLNENLQIHLNRIHNIEVELSALRATGADPTEIAEEVAVLDHEIETLTQQWNAYKFAIEKLNTASGKLREGISPKLAKNASKLFSAMTEGKYDTIGLDTDFALSFSDGNTMRDAAFLSTGTNDLAYICLRIALIEMLYKRSVPPFLFDESFAHMDDKRMEKVLTLIYKYSQRNYQSILFTCHSREKDALKSIGAHKIISL